jgi:iron(III) transport system ATP-binding protein
MTRKATADLLAEAGVASILVTHDQNEALSFATQVAVMRPGASRRSGRLMTFTPVPLTKRRRCFLAMRDPPAQLAAGYAVCAG